MQMGNQYYVLDVELSESLYVEGENQRVVAAVVLLIAVVAVAFVTSRQWATLRRQCEQIATPNYTLWCDGDNCLRLLTFTPTLPTTSAARLIALSFSSIHMFSLGAVVGAAVTMRLIQLLWPHNEIDFPVRALLWVGIVATVWLGVFVAEHMELRSLVLEKRRSLSDEWGVIDPILLAGALHAHLTRHRLYLLALAAVGLPAPWHVTLLIVVGVGALCWFLWRKPSSQVFLAAMPSELERPFLPMREQMRDGIWVAPMGLLLVIGAAALLYFNDVSSLVLAALCAVGCALVVASERISRIHSHHMTLSQFRERMSQLLGANMSGAPAGTQFPA